MKVEFQAFLLFLGAALLAAITPGPGMFYVAARPFAGGRPHGLGLGTGVGGLCMLLPGRSGSLRSSWRVRKPSLCSSTPEPSIRSGWVKTWTEATIVDPIGVEIVGVERAFWRCIIVEVLNPKTDAVFSPSPRDS